MWSRSQRVWSSCGQRGCYALSMVCPHVPKGSDWSEGRVHISTSFSFLLKVHFSSVFYNLTTGANVVDYKIQHTLQWRIVDFLLYYTHSDKIFRV